MAQTLQERFKAAKNPRARDADIETTIADAKSELARTIAARTRAAAESIDFALGEADRDDAAAKADRHDRNAKALTSAIAEAESMLVARRDSEKRKAAEAVEAAAREERDALAERFKAEVPGLLANLVEIFGLVEANAAKLEALYIREPNAEETARGVRILGIGGGAESLTKIRIPHWDRGGHRMWPLETPMVMFDYAKAIADARQREVDRQERARFAAEEHRRTHGVYCLTSLIGGPSPVFIPENVSGGLVPTAIFSGDPWKGEIPHTIAEKLRDIKHLSVTDLSAVA